MDTNKHRFLKDKTNLIIWFYPIFISVHLCKSAAKVSLLFRVL